MTALERIAEGVVRSTVPELKIARGFVLPLDLVTEATAIVATRGAGKSSASAVLVEEAFAASVQCVVFDRTGVYWGLRSSAKGDGPGLPIYVLGGPHADVSLEPHAGILIADLVVDSGHSFVLDLSDFSKSGAIRFAADFLERLYDRKARARSTTLLVMDEAHFYAPQTPRGGFKGEAAKLMGAMEDVVGLGRSRGLGVVLTTQRTQALNKAVLDLIETLLVMRMLSPRARDAVQDWIREKHEDDREGVIATLESLPTGTAWVWSPLRGILEKIAVRRIETFDSYDTPKPGQVRVEPTARRELDLDALGEQMRETAERAKENDPSELRRRLRDAEDRLRKAERQLAELPAAPAEAERVEVEVLVPVEVPVLAPGNTLETVLMPILRNLPDHLDRAITEIVRLRESVDARKIPESRPAAPASVRSTSRRQTPPPSTRPEGHATASTRTGPRAAPDTGASGGASITGPQQRILDAIAWWGRVGVDEPSVGQIAFVVGNHPRSKGFTNNLSALSTAGLIDRGLGAARLTDAGRELATEPAFMPTDDELQQMIYDQVGGKRAALLREIIRHGRDWVTMEKLAGEMDYHPRSKGFTNNVSSLSGLGLIERAPGQVRASDLCFL